MRSGMGDTERQIMDHCRSTPRYYRGSYGSSPRRLSPEIRESGSHHPSGLTLNERAVVTLSRTLGFDRSASRSSLLAGSLPVPCGSLTERFNSELAPPAAHLG